MTAATRTAPSTKVLLVFFMTASSCGFGDAGCAPRGDIAKDTKNPDGLATTSRLGPRHRRTGNRDERADRLVRETQGDDDLGGGRRAQRRDPARATRRGRQTHETRAGIGVAGVGAGALDG